MPQEIYNEGRVVGFSAWELFVREALNNGVPAADIPDEHEWLASMVGIGASMILRIPANTAAGVHDYALPTGSDLAASGIIFANPFLGECEWNSSTWATKITSYSPLIENNSSHHPETNVQAVPYDSDYDPEVYADAVTEFAKITDGIVFLQSAEWLDTNSTPEKDINPKFNQSSAVVRLYISADIENDVKILLTGFNNKRILQGVSGHAVDGDTSCIGGSTDTTKNNWKSGGMLGPEIVPWATKIVFSVPNAYYNLLNKITRTIPSDTSYTAKTLGTYIRFQNVDSTVRANPLIDFKSVDPLDYYNEFDSTFGGDSPTLAEDISAVSMGTGDSYNTLVAWYPGMTATRIKAANDTSNIFPPALFAAQVTATGSQTLVPLDTAAPGTMKGFSDSTRAYSYTQLMPNNFAVYYNPSTSMFSFVVPGQSNPNNWSGTAKIEYAAEPKATITAGSNSVNVIALNNSAGTAYDTSGSDGDTLTTTEGKVTWTEMLNALKNGKTIDVYSTRTRNFTDELVSNKIGVATSNPITDIKTSNSVETISGKAQTVTLVQSNDTSKTTQLSTVTANSATMTGFSTSIKVSTQFIEFADGKRLYIAGTAPTGTIPNGSIGIGW